MVNMRRMATERKYRKDFVLKHNANVLNMPSTDMACCDRLHGLCKHPRCHGSHVLDMAVELLLDFEPSLQLSNLASHPNIPAD